MWFKLEGSRNRSFRGSKVVWHFREVIKISGVGYSAGFVPLTFSIVLLIMDNEEISA